MICTFPENKTLWFFYNILSKETKVGMRKPQRRKVGGRSRERLLSPEGEGKGEQEEAGARCAAGCVNNVVSRRSTRVARIKSHNALVQTNARWRCYGVGEFTTPESSSSAPARPGGKGRNASKENVSNIFPRF